ncbi:MAG: hypothetical protein WAK40_01375 [Thermoplasmata archaeon]
MARSPAVRLAAILLVLVTVASSLAVAAAAPIAAANASHSGFAVRASDGPAAVHLAARTSSGTSITDHPSPDITYAIFFTETGLPAGLNWQVTVGHATDTYVTDGSTDTLVFGEPNGPYSYSIQDLSGWHQTNISYHGTVTVSGASVTEPTLTYTQVTYPVSFTESALPALETFQVTLGVNPQSLTTDAGPDTLSFSVPNGTYAYAIADISGWHQTSLAYHGSAVVNGAGIIEPTLNYVPVTYTIKFQETGLPSGQTWQVSVGGDPQSLLTNGGLDSLTWSGLPNGTYSYSITDISGFHEASLAYHGSIVVNNSPVTEATLVYVPVTYSILFTESGLPSGQTFQVTVGRVGESLLTDGGTDSLYFTESNGTYSYTIGGISGWHQTTLAYSGSVDVAGVPITESTLIYFQVNYTVTFTESGLPGGTSWNVTLNGNTIGSTSSTIVFSEPNATYGYHIDYVAGYKTTPSSSSTTVDGGAVSVAVPFTQVTYTLTFDQSTLPHATSWSVRIGVTSVSSTGSSIAFTVPNGTYDYTIGYVAGYVPTSPTGSATVNGGAVLVTIAFTQVKYTLTFTETGLPTSAHPKAWSVSLDGVLQTTTSTSIAFPVANGTHSYLVRGPSGFRVSSVLPPAGTIVVNGASVPQSVTFVRGATGTVSFHEVGLATDTKWCVTLGSLLCSTTPKIVSKNLTPGTYSYAITTFHGISTIVTINGASVGISGGVALAHATSVKVRFAYGVTFTESGLPFSTSWKVTAGSQSVISTSTTIVLYLTNGTYTFHVGAVTGYTASPGSGGLHIAGATLAVSVRFSPAIHH